MFPERTLPRGVSRAGGTGEGGRKRHSGTGTCGKLFLPETLGEERVLELVRDAAVGEVSPTGALEEGLGQCQSRRQQEGRQEHVFLSASPHPLCQVSRCCFGPTNKKPQGRAQKSTSRGLSRVEKGGQRSRGVSGDAWHT